MAEHRKVAELTALEEAAVESGADQATVTAAHDKVEAELKLEQAAIEAEGKAHTAVELAHSEVELAETRVHQEEALALVNARHRPEARSTSMLPANDKPFKTAACENAETCAGLPEAKRGNGSGCFNGI